MEKPIPINPLNIHGSRLGVQTAPEIILSLHIIKLYCAGSFFYLFIQARAIRYQTKNKLQQVKKLSSGIEQNAHSHC